MLPLDAAGGIISTANDMTRWLEFHLNTGRDAAGNQLLPVSYWLQIHSPQMVLDQPQLPVVRPWFPASDTYSAYGFGWRLGMYRGMSKLCYLPVLDPTVGSSALLEKGIWGQLIDGAEGIPSPATTGSGEHRELPSEVWGRAPAGNAFWHILKATERSFLHLYYYYYFI